MTLISLPDIGWRLVETGRGILERDVDIFAIQLGRIIIIPTDNLYFSELTPPTSGYGWMRMLSWVRHVAFLNVMR